MADEQVVADEPISLPPTRASSLLHDCSDAVEGGSLTFHPTHLVREVADPGATTTVVTRIAVGALVDERFERRPALWWGILLMVVGAAAAAWSLRTGGVPEPRTLQLAVEGVFVGSGVAIAFITRAWRRLMVVSPTGHVWFSLETLTDEPPWANALHHWMEV